jgi:hypothetical protein
MQDQNFVEQQTEKVPTEEEVKLRTDLLNGVKTTLLPESRSLLTQLQEALDLFTESTEPKPKLNEALDVVSRLSTTLNTLSVSIYTLSPTILSLGRKSSRIDQTWGVLKRFRCYILKTAVEELISQYLLAFFVQLSQFVSSGEYAQGGSEYSDEEDASKLLTRRTQLLATNDKIQSAIDMPLTLLDRSDFGILRHMWNEHEIELGDSLAQIAQRIHEAKDLEVPSADHPFNLKPRLIHLLEQLVPLVKLARVFYRKVGSGPPPFTFGEEMCSADLEIIRRRSGMINNNLSYIVSYLLRTYRDQTVQRASKLPTFSNAAKVAMKDTLELIATHMVPSDPARTVDDIMEELFGMLKSQFNPTCERFLAAVNEFESVNQRFINEADILDQQ